MKLFTKVNCNKCDMIKENVDLNLAGVTVKELNNDNYEALADLAWHELVTVAETTMPILVLDDDSSITGALKIKKYLTKVVEDKVVTH